jgi:glycosyltransferase involved in cell wall biosynthesis
MDEGVRPGITVVIPSIPPRIAMLERALTSVHDAMVCAKLEHLGVPIHYRVEYDQEREGAPAVRHRGLMAVDTEWVAFLDDDDVMHSDHLVELYRDAVEHQADYVWSRFQICFPDGRVFQGPQFLGEKAFSQWNDDDPCQTTITTLVRTELAQSAGGFLFNDDGSEVDGNRRGEDHVFTLRCRTAGGVFRHVEKVTWDWWHHASNTSGLPIW